MKRNERVKQCTVIDEMESNYVNVDRNQDLQAKKKSLKSKNLSKMKF